MGLRPVEFWDLTPFEFSLLAKNFIKRNVENWNMIRTLAAWTLQPYGKVTPDALMKLPGDSKKTELMTKDEFENLLKRYN